MAVPRFIVGIAEGDLLRLPSAVKKRVANIRPIDLRWKPIIVPMIIFIRLSVSNDDPAQPLDSTCTDEPRYYFANKESMDRRQRLPIHGVGTDYVTLWDIDTTLKTIAPCAVDLLAVS